MTFYDVKINDLKDLPAFPAALKKLIFMIENDSTSFEEIAQIITLDPYLMTKILALANSAYYGGTRKITNIIQAVTRIGTKEIKHIAVSIYLNKLFKNINLNNIILRKFWQHSIATAFISNYIARYFHDHIKQFIKDEEQFYTIGLLHDIAYLILDVYLPEKVEYIIEMMEKSDKSSILEIEADLGFFHAREGANLLRYWEIPESIVTSIEYHHDPENCRGEHYLKTGLLNVADYLAVQMDLNVFNRKDLTPLNKDIWSKFKFSSYNKIEYGSFFSDLNSQVVMFLTLSESILEM